MRQDLPGDALTTAWFLFSTFLTGCLLASWIPLLLSNETSAHVSKKKTGINWFVRGGLCSPRFAVAAVATTTTTAVAAVATDSAAAVATAATTTAAVSVVIVAAFEVKPLRSRSDTCSDFK